LLRFAQDLSQYGTIESQPRLEGRNAHVLLSPVKIEKQHAPKEKEPKEKEAAKPKPAGGNGAPPASS